MTIKLVRDLMHIGVTTCRVEMPMMEAVRILLRDRLESLIVLDNHGHAVGVFGRREAVIAYGRLGEDIRDDVTITVTEAMRVDIPEVPPDIPANAAAQLMLDQGIRDIYLMHHDGGIRWPAAVLRYEDVLRNIAAEPDPEMDRIGVNAPRQSPVETFKKRYSQTQ